jgi:hypothetical protein
MLKKPNNYSWLLGILIVGLSIAILALKRQYSSCLIQNKALLVKEEVLTDRLIEVGNILRVKKNDSIIYFSRSKTYLDFQDVIKSLPKLVLIIDPNSCNTCVIEALDFLNLFNSKFGKDNALVFVKTESQILLKRTEIDYGISNTTVGYHNGELFPFSHDMQRPYFVILLPNGYTFAFFFSIDNYPEITEKYILSLRQTYFQSSKNN